MVGREEEFARLRRLVDELVTARRGRLVLVTGQAGIGKSRLTSELKEYVAPQWVTILEGACLAYGQPAYGVFLQILKALFGIAADDTEEIAREKIERLAQDLFSAEEFSQIVPYLEHLLSIRIFEKELAARIRHLTPAQLQQQTFIAIRELLVALAQGKPLVLILEDIHWIDQLSLDLLTFLLNSIERAPVLIYCNSRPDEGVAAGKLEQLGSEMYAAHYAQLPLAPLSRADSVALVDLLLTMRELPEHLRHLIPERAEGNPFYLEEIIRMLIDRGIIRRGEARWEMTPEANLDDLQVPTTLQGLIMTRVDHLSENARQTLQCASVIGRAFALRLLEHIGGDILIRQAIPELEERQLITCVARDGEMRYHFNHVLIQETVYHSLLTRRREYLRRKIAMAIELLYKDRLDEHLDELAFHFAESQDFDRALPYAIRAGKHAAERFANEQALKHYQRAVEMLTRTQPTFEQRIEVYTGLGAVQTLTGDYTGATTTYLIALQVARTAAQSLENTRRSAEIMRAIGRLGERRGDYAEALHWLESALHEIQADPDERSAERARIYNDMGWVQYRRGEFDQAYAWRMRAPQIVEGSEYYNEMASAYNGLVALFGRQGEWERANAYAEKGLRLRERIGDLQGISQSYTSMAVSEWEQGDWQRAREHLARSLDIKQKIGDIEGIARLESNLSELYRGMGEYARALELAARALRGAEKIKNTNLINLALINLAHAQLLQGQWEEAHARLTRALTLATEMGSKERIAEARGLLAQTHLARGQLDLARQEAEQALTLATEIGRRSIEGQVLRVLGQIAQQQNEIGMAREYLERSVAVLSASKHQFELAQSQLQLAVLGRETGCAQAARSLLEHACQTFAQLGARVEHARARAELERLTASLEDRV